MTSNTYHIEAIIENCRDLFGKTPHFKKASSEDIAWLKDSGIPASILEFFTMYEPVNTIESDGVHLVPIHQLKAENTQAVPGVVVNQYGWVVIATTISGDAYCVDTRSKGKDMSIYIVSHERGMDATFEDIKQHSRIVAQSFDEFLQKFAQNILPYDVDLID